MCKKCSAYSSNMKAVFHSESLKVSIRRRQASGFFRISPNSASAFSSLENIVAIKKTLFLFISNYYYRFIMPRCEILLSYCCYMQNTFYTFSKCPYNEHCNHEIARGK